MSGSPSFTRVCPTCKRRSKTGSGCPWCEEIERAARAAHAKSQALKTCQDCGTAIASGHWCRSCYDARKASGRSVSGGGKP